MANPSIKEEHQYWKRKGRLDELQRQFGSKQDWQIKALANSNPAAAEYIQLKSQQDPSAVRGGIADSNPVTDFLGNAMWRFGENLSFGITSGADMFAEGAGSEAFGAQEW